MMYEYTLCFKTAANAAKFIAKYKDNLDVAIQDVGVQYIGSKIGVDEDGVDIINYTPTEGYYIYVCSRTPIESSVIIPDPNPTTGFM